MDEFAVEATAQAAGHHGDLTGVAVVVLAALACGFGMERLKQPAIVGYILAGVLLGPSIFGVVEDRSRIDVLAELGVLMLLFAIGMELSLRVFRRLWRLAFMAVAVQVGASVGTMLLLSKVFGWSIGLSVLLGFVVALSSTAVAVKVLDDIGESRTRAGRLAIAVLIAQDLAIVPMILGIGAMSSGSFDWWSLPKIFLALLFLAWLIRRLSSGTLVHLPYMEQLSQNEELKPLAALAFCFGCAAVMGGFGLSAAYGAFIAGLILGNTAHRHEMAKVTNPIERILIMLFFVSIGLLLDVRYLWDNLGEVLLILLFVSVFKTVLNVGFFGFVGQPWRHAYLAGTMLAQIGEFSFLLSVVGISAGVIDGEAGRLVIAVTVLSLAVSPLWVVTARRVQALAQGGITSGREFTRLIYAPEAELVAETVEGARSWAHILARLAALRARKWRLHRRLKRKAAEQAEAGQEAKQASENKETDKALPAASNNTSPSGEPVGSANASATKTDAPETSKRTKTGSRTSKSKPKSDRT